MNALAVLAAGLLLAVVAARWSSRSIEGSTRVAIVAVLGVTAAAFNIVVPIPSIEATTTVVLCTALMLGARTGAAVGIVAIVASSVTGGIGAWTIWQIVAVALVAVIGAVIGRMHGDAADWFTAPRVVTLGLGAGLAALVWDIVTTVGGAASYAPAPGLTPLQQVVAALLIGAAFTIVHVIFTTMLTAIGGPPLLHALGRARPRLDGGRVEP